MSKIGGHRNFGYGKRMAWAGKQALRDRYGTGRYATVAAHTERWRQFSAWCHEVFGIRDARHVDRDVVEAYGQSMANSVANSELSVSYAQNLLSTVNVVLESMRGDRQIRIAPSSFVGQRTLVRTEPPVGLDRKSVRQCAAHLRSNGHERIGSVVELARELGLRLREASLLDARGAVRQAMQRGSVNITAGTKGGRGKHVDRWVPVTKTAMGCLVRAARVQGDGRNLIPPELSWKQWNTRVHHVWASVRDDYGLSKIHDLRAAYACERYRQLTGANAPVIARSRQASRTVDRNARNVIAQELGHTRSDVVATYIGGTR
ncbi:MAG: integrase [Acidimicrobiia bacterium]|nr:integrase [Acidimicrobiia bacterium]